MKNLLANKRNLKIFSNVMAFAIIGSLLMIAGPLLTPNKIAYAQSEPGSVLKLASANIPIDIPLLKGYVNGKEMYVIATDASDKETSDLITNKTGFKANVAPILSKTPTDVLAQVYVFKNGIKGDGLFGFQSPVLSVKPGDNGYSPLYQLNTVEWVNQESAQELKSIDEILTADNNGQLMIEKTNVVVNKPAVKWDGGELMIKEGEINDETFYGEGQVTKIDIENMIVTFVAHRGWDPDGSTIYYIVTDAVPEMPANMMGVVFAPSDENTTTLLVEPKFINKGMQVGYIEDVSVRKGYEGQGIGFKLVNYATGYAISNHGCKKILLYCSEKNRPFYEKLGYKLSNDTLVMKFES